MHQSVGSDVHCVNPKCPRPFPQIWGNKFCHSCGSPLQLQNRYVPLQRLGSGGFATIYTVWDLETQTERVLKVMVEASPKARALFEQEADVLANLRHPGVPRVEPDGYFQLIFGNPPSQSLPCLVMEKINGYTLEEISEQYPQGCPEEWVISWLKQGVEILQELHSRQIIHRDIKPSNLMLRDGTGQLVLIDFGGAKQIGSAQSPSFASSTRLFSSGYSPPEQIAGGAVGPATDLYALGRTVIQLLTGKSPPELEDPMTSEFRWHEAGANVTPAVVALLDDMVREDVRLRPTSAAAIQKRLARISQRVAKQGSFSKLISKVARTVLDWSWVAIASFSKSLSQTILFVLRVIVQMARACWDTLLEMVLSASGSCVGTSAGFVLAYLSPLGDEVARIMSEYLSSLVPSIQFGVGSDILVFAAAGLGTAWGLTVAGGFGQRRRYLVGSLMGVLAYGLGWFVWLAATPYAGSNAMTGMIAVGVALLTLGLGLPSHHLVHAVVASAGTATIFEGLVSLNLFPTALFHFSHQPSWFDLLVCITFFGFVSIVLSFWLGVSYYLIVPLLRLLGWR